MSDPLIIELRANESARRDERRPRLPLTPDEIVADAAAAAHSGATILHWHARDPVSGRTSNDVALNSHVCRGVRAATDLLLHPTLGAAGCHDPLERTAHVVALQSDPALRVDLVPVDFGSMNFDRWDSAEQRFHTEDVVYLNSRASLRRTLEILRRLELPVVTVCWSVGQIRTARAFQEMGLLDAALWELMFTGESLPDGMAPTRKGLEAMVEQLPAGQPWSVACIDGDALELAAWAIELGGHVSIGLGDWPYQRLGSPSNADLVSHVVGLAARAGRGVATVAETRTLLGLPAQADFLQREPFGKRQT